MGLSDHERRTLQELEGTLSTQWPPTRTVGVAALHRHRAIRVGVGIAGALVGLWLVVLGVRIDSHTGIVIAVAGYGLIVSALDATLPRRFRLPPLQRSERLGCTNPLDR
jgi:hypothetical protein